jgi:hypothetical protein
MTLCLHLEYMDTLISEVCYESNQESSVKDWNSKWPPDANATASLQKIQNAPCEEACNKLHNTIGKLGKFMINSSK